MDMVEILDESKSLVNGLNLYAYCGNNPVVRTDETGEKWWKWVAGALAVVALAALVVFSFGIAAPIAGAVILVL